jgi:rhodanese-related sulfurtransferase
MSPVPIPTITSLEPIASLSDGRAKELASLCSVETVTQGLDPFRMNVTKSTQSLYLLQGELKLVFADGHSTVLRGGSDETRHPVITDAAPLKEAVALTDIQILRIDAELLDIMLTWDQLAGYEHGSSAAYPGQHVATWMQDTQVFSAASLKGGIFSNLPPENVEEMFRRMQRIAVNAGQIIIRQGAEGDYYYLIESGTARVTRTSGENVFPETLAELSAGQAFGEEALVSGNKRNATVTMKTEGVLLRLGKDDFVELLKKPLLKTVSAEEAKVKVQNGAVLLDVRTPAEFNFKHLPGAVNMPLHDIRALAKTLDRLKEHIVYCQTGRRATAAAFILAQSGFRVEVVAFDDSVGRS